MLAWSRPLEGLLCGCGGQVYLDGLNKLARSAVEDQDLVAFGDNGVPRPRLGERCGAAAVGQDDRVGQRRRRLIEADDNQRRDEYDACDHCHGQHRHQPSQEAQVGWFGGLILGGVIHV